MCLRAPVHIHMAGDAVNPGSHRRPPCERGQRLPDAAEGGLGEICGIGLVGGQASQKGIHPLVELFDQANRRRFVPGTGRFDQLIEVAVHCSLLV